MVETWTSPLDAQTIAGLAIGSKVDGSSRKATRSRAPGLRAIGTVLDQLPVVAVVEIDRLRRLWIEDASAPPRREPRSPRAPARAR